MAEHVCPWWMGYFLASPVRRLFEKPEIMLKPYIQSLRARLEEVLAEKTSLERDREAVKEQVASILRALEALG